MTMDLLYWQNQMKPCPFCNSVVTLKQTDDASKLVAIACDAESKCIGSGLGQYMLIELMETAVEVWNSRPKLN